MRIAQVSPLIESVPPRLYGGTERIVHYLTEELVTQGHDVTLFASGDSETSARLVPCAPRALRLDPSVRDALPHTIAMLSRLRRMADEFDILHFHIDQVHFPAFQDLASRTVTTLHGSQACPDLKHAYASAPEMNLVGISASQCAPIPRASVIATVQHGLPRNLLPPTLRPRGGYLAFLGRVSPEKGLDQAISIAESVGLPLKIAAKVDKADESYFRSIIAPLLGKPGVTYIGEIDERQKAKFLGEASALLFPISWAEPFGLVMIEAMACGTPVLAFNAGSVPEVIDEGVTGFVVENVEEAVGTMGALLALDRAAIRRKFEERFTATRMVADYAKIYQRLLTAPVRSPLPLKPPVAAELAGPRFA